MAFRGSYYPVRDAIRSLFRIPWESCTHLLPGMKAKGNCPALSKHIAGGAARYAEVTHQPVQVKDVIDGDLCEQYSQLPAQKQKQIADDLERTPGEVLKKLEDIRNQIY